MNDALEFLDVAHMGSGDYTVGGWVLSFVVEDH